MNAKAAYQPSYTITQAILNQVSDAVTESFRPTQSRSKAERYLYAASPSCWTTSSACAKERKCAASIFGPGQPDE